jgi:ABC-type polysaccharide/polyol phosphate export permease
MKFIIYAVAAGAFASWLIALLSGIRMFGLLSGRLPASAMMFRGIEWFNAANFKPEAAPVRRTFTRAFIAFFICVIAIAVLAMLAARPT